MKNTSRFFSACSAWMTAWLILIVSTQAASVLDPRAFTSLGASPFSETGNYTVNTNGATPVITRPNGTTITGVISDGVAVFAFSNLTIGTGVSIRGSGSQPLALLSQDFFMMTGGVIDVSGYNGGPFSGEPGGYGGSGGPGGFAGGYGGSYSRISHAGPGYAGFGPGKGGTGYYTGAGGGFGGRGWGETNAYGRAYGDLLTTFEGGLASVLLEGLEAEAEAERSN